jgi:hypothetical protein
MCPATKTIVNEWFRALRPALRSHRSGEVERGGHSRRICCKAALQETRWVTGLAVIPGLSVKLPAVHCAGSFGRHCERAVGAVLLPSTFLSPCHICRCAFVVKAAGNTPIPRLGVGEGTKPVSQCGGGNVRHRFLAFPQCAPRGRQRAAGRATRRARFARHKAFKSRNGGLLGVFRTQWFWTEKKHKRSTLFSRSTKFYRPPSYPRLYVGLKTLKSG